MSFKNEMAGLSDVPIRDAACVVVFDDDHNETKLLLGKRRDDQAFLPGLWVFPGGRVDDVDLQPNEAGLIFPPALRRFALAAARELAEETGLGLSADDLKPLARAITPPGQPRRFDTWFFLASRCSVLNSGADGDGEFADLGWFTINQTRELNIPGITRLVVDDVEAELSRALAPASPRVPFYCSNSDGFQRTMLDLGCVRS